MSVDNKINMVELEYTKDKKLRNSLYPDTSDTTQTTG